MLSGYADPDARVSGISIHILDRRVNHRVVATFRTEGNPDAAYEASQRLRELREIER